MRFGVGFGIDFVFGCRIVYFDVIVFFVRKVGNCLGFYCWDVECFRCYNVVWFFGVRRY